MDRLRDFDSQLMSNNEKESIILLVVFGSQNPGLWTGENFNDEELLRMWKQAIQKHNESIPKRPICVDLDGTIVCLRRVKQSLTERMAEMFQSVPSTKDSYSDEAFEARSLRLCFYGRVYLVTFRRGTFRLLRFLSRVSTIQIVTHASRNYASKVVDFLTKVCGVPMELMCVRMPTLKYVPNPYWIIDDQRRRWHRLNADAVTVVSVFDHTNAAEDDELIRIRHQKVLGIILKNIPAHLCSLILEYRGYKALPAMSKLRKCIRCATVWAPKREVCTRCIHRTSTHTMDVSVV